MDFAARGRPDDPLVSDDWSVMSFEPYPEPDDVVDSLLDAPLDEDEGEDGDDRKAGTADG